MKKARGQTWLAAGINGSRGVERWRELIVLVAAVKILPCTKFAKNKLVLNTYRLCTVSRFISGGGGDDDDS
jgi:hypothetical protein